MTESSTEPADEYTDGIVTPTTLVGAQRVDRERQRERAVDAAGRADHGLREAAAARVVAQPQHAGDVVRLVALFDRRDGTVDAAPAIAATLPYQRLDGFLEGRELERKRAVGMQPERSAIEDQFVLASDLVGIDERQIAFGGPRDRDIEPNLLLVVRVRRTVGHDQKLGSGLGQTLDHVLVVAHSVQMFSQIGTPMRTPRKLTGPGGGPGANRRRSSNTP